MKHTIRILLILIIGILILERMLYSLCPLEYEDAINRYSEKYSLDRHLVMSVIRVESNFDENAHSGVACGLMQLTEPTAEWLSKKTDIEYSDIYDPETNIELGCFYLSYLLERFSGDRTLALAAYNAGPNTVKDWLSNSQYSENGETLSRIPYSETEDYIKRINKFYPVYKTLY